VGVHTTYTSFLHIYMQGKSKDTFFHRYDSNKGGIDGSHNRIISEKDVKDTLISLFAMQSEIEIQQFLTRYPKIQQPTVDIILDNLKRDGEIFEHKPGFIKLL